MTSQSTRFISGLAKAAIFSVATAALAMPAAAQFHYASTGVPNGQERPASIADLVERISPAVVNIKATTDDGVTTSKGDGSGFVISPQGEVVTNYHVIKDSTSVDVVFNNDVSFPARILGTDEETDLALLKIDNPDGFPSVPFYKGPPIRIGDWVIAIGNPFGIGQSTSLGIISAIGRDRVESGAYVDFIQTDATINRGNSGGPLFNPAGQVVGVNSAILSPTGASVGIAFSIPHETAEEVVMALRAEGRVRRGWLGAGLRTAELSRGNNASPFRSGAIINNLVPGSPAHKYGLQIDDIIMKINGQAVADSTEATRLIGKFKPGQQVQFEFERADTIQGLALIVDERPAKSAVDQARNGGAISSAPTPSYPQSPGRAAAPAPSASGNSVAGMRMFDLSSEFRKSIGMRSDQVGVYVEQVAGNSAASRHGIEGNMVLLEADRAPIASVRGFKKMIAIAKQNNVAEIMLLVRTINGSEDYVRLPI